VNPKRFDMASKQFYKIDLPEIGKRVKVTTPTGYYWVSKGSPEGIRIAVKKAKKLSNLKKVS
jgi:hypothetical protein